MVTTTVLELLSRLRSLNVKLEVDGERLRFRAPLGVLTPELREAIMKEKDAILEFLKESTQTTQLPPIVLSPEDRYEPFPLTDVQQANWIGRTGNFELGNVSTHLYVELEENGLNPKRLEQAWQKLIQRHDMLRAIVRPDGQQQILRTVPEYKIEVLDLRGKESYVVDAQLLAIRDKLSHQVLPADKWPLFDVKVSLMDNNLVRLYISIDLLIADGRSCQILIREFAELYKNPEIELPTLDLLFRDCVLAEVELQKTDIYKRSLEYWQKRLPILPAAPKLPLCRKPETLKDPSFVRRKGRLAPKSWKKIKSYASKAGLTLPAVILNAFVQVLSTWSKNKDFTINMTLFNRLPLHPQINDIIGDFSSLVFLAVENSGQGTFEEQTRKLQERLWEDLDHRYVSGVRIMRELTKLRGSQAEAMTVVFTSELDNTDEEAFVDQNAPLIKENSDSVEIVGLGKEIYGISQTPQIWLDHQVAERGGALFYNWDAVEDLFYDGLLDDMFKAYKEILDNLAGNEKTWQLTTHELVSIPAYQKEILETLRASTTDTEMQTNDLLHTLIAKQVSLQPHQTAIITPERELTYEELYLKANQVGRWLRLKGACPNKFIGVLMEKGWEQAVAVLGVLHSGAAYLPISADYPKERIEYLLTNGEVDLVITQSWVDEKIIWPQHIQRLVIDSDEMQKLDSQALEMSQKPEDLAYVIYTSGSTGEPKGVMIDHVGAVNTIVDINQRFDLQLADRVLAISALTFDLSVFDIFGTLAFGGTVVYPDFKADRDPGHWLKLVEQTKVTVWNTVPAFMEMLVSHVEGRMERLPASLRLIMLSGDWIPVTLPDRIRSLSDNVQIISLGGATEASIWSIIYPIGEVNQDWASIPYGKPMTNQAFYVLDEFLEERPIWVPGDLYIGGKGLAKGYWKDAEKTAISFITHPKTGEILYRTGDLGRYLPDGNIEFLGREDQQIKIHGYRIELEEIEAVLLQYPEVNSAVAVVVDEANGAKRLLAYVVPTSDETVDLDDLKGFLKAKLPHYMIPGTILILSALPTNINGKVDRRVLSTGEYATKLSNSVFVAARTELENELAGLVAEELFIEEVGVTDNFFDLGGDSIIAAQVFAKIYQRYNLELPIQSFFETPTVIALAEMIESELEAAACRELSVNELPTIVPSIEDLHKPFPLTGLQQAYLVGRSDAVALGNVACHTYQEVDIKEFDIQRFDQVWQRLIKRHDVLRTIVLPDGQQQVLKDIPHYEIKVQDFRGEDPEYITTELDKLREYMSHQILTTDQWPLFDIRVSLVDGEITRLHLSVDALIADAWSVGLLTEEASRVYQNLNEPLVPLDITFRDYVVGLEALKETDLYKRSLDYWFSRVNTLPAAPDLPLAKNYASIKEPKFARRGGELTLEEWNRLKEKATRVGLTAAGVVMAAFAEVLSLWSKSPRFTLNIPHFNRLPLHPHVNNLVGEFASFYLLEVDNSIYESFKERAKQVQKQLWQDMNHRYVSGVEILRELARIQKGSPQVSMPIVYTSTIGLLDSGNTERFSEEKSPLSMLGQIVYSISQTPQVWLDCQVGEKDGALTYNWDAVEELFPEGLLNDMFTAYDRLLHDLANTEETWNGQLGQLIPQWQLAQKREINATDANLSDELLHTLFTTQVEQNPDYMAVIAHEKSLSYEELYKSANQLGRMLRMENAKPNELVAIVMEKGWEQIVAVLGVLQSGAAFLPIDPQLPKDRVWYILENAEVKIVLTQSHLNGIIPWPDHVEVKILDSENIFKGISAEPLLPIQTPDDLAYVIYTSGSSGFPKGVMITHRNVVNVVLNTNAEFNIGAGDRAINITALHHDLAMYDIFGMLASGGTVVIPNQDLRLNPTHWLQLITAERITIWNTVPAMIEMLVTYLEEESILLPDSLRLTILGGDWVPVTLPDRLRARAKNTEILTIGGPTETTIWNIWYKVGEVDPEWASIPYGKPTANSKYYIFNEMMQDCPVWVPGEMYCSGVQLARGYWKDDEKTKASFIPHPLSGERLYCTGDIGRYLADGNIEFIGRADFQIKIRGQRIELGEIEAVLTRHPQVRTSVVALKGESNEDKHLVGYVVLEKSGQSESDKREENFLETLPDGIISDPIERMEFKRKHLGIRQFTEDQTVIELSKPEFDEVFLDSYISRRSYRNFKKEPIQLDDFNKLLSCMLQVNFEDLPFPKYQYASGGGLYPVQAYLYIKPDRVEGLSGGAYYYNAEKHQLTLIKSYAEIDGNPHTENEQTFIDHAAFSIFLIGELKAIEPMYGEEYSKRFSYLEAGLIAQLLESKAFNYSIGLCGIGIVEQERVWDIFDLGESHLFLHCLIGGGVDVTGDKYQALVKDWGAYQIASLSNDEPSQDIPLNQLLKEYLNKLLPPYMIPAAIVELNEIPLTPNGKVDRQALPEHEEEDGWRRSANSNKYVAPRTPVEIMLAEIWADVIGTNRVGIYNSFFELGGQSLLAMQVVARMQQVLQVEIPLRMLFDNLTIASLAERIEEIMKSGRDLSSVPLVPVSREGALPLSFAQQRLWFLDRLDPGNPAYNVTAATRMTGLLDIDALERAFNEVIRRHESLRTVFTMLDGKAVQVIQSEVNVTLPLIDIQHLSRDEQEQTLQQIATEQAHKSFDLTTGPLVRCLLFKLGDFEHVLIMSMHHIVSDAWSIGVFIQEITAIAKAFTDDKPSPLPELKIQYADYASWQRQWLQGETLDNQLVYWKEWLKDAPPYLDLPTDRPRPNVLTYEGKIQTFTIPKELVSSLKDFCRQEGVTLFMTLLASFNVLLNKYTGQEDIIVGSPIAGRNRHEIEELIGFFVNMLALRTDLSGTPTFKELVARVREVTLGAYANQDLPFEVLVDALNLERDLSRNPLFQVAFSLQNLPGEPMKHFQFSDVELEPVDIDREMAQFELTLTMMEINEELTANMEYNVGLFDDATISRMIEHMIILLEGIAKNPEMKICELPMLTDAEVDKLLGEWNQTSCAYPVDKCIQELFAAQVELTSDHVALVSEGQEITYRELNNSANQLAYGLMEMGVEPETIVGIYMDRSPEAITAILGVLKAGGCYLPIDPAYPQQRLEFILKDAQVSIIITQSQLRSRLPEGYTGEVLCLDQHADILATKPQDNPVSEVKPENLAYIIYTSGSTGLPKGVLVEHRGLCNLITAQIKKFGLLANSRVLQFSTFSFDASVSEIFTTLISGARLYIEEREKLMSGVRINQLLCEYEITTLTLTPTVLDMVSLDGLDKLETVIVAGEACPATLAERWAGKYRFFNAYGPTEGTVCSTMELCTADGEVPSIGRPISNVTIYVLDKYFRPVPIGVTGEIYLGGVGVARGYLNRSELTAQRFMENPLIPGERVYRTGDLACYLPDGNLKFIGRSDSQVKFHGYRIELGEIETVLLQHPSIREAIVVALTTDKTVKHLSGQAERLVAYVVTTSKSEELTDKLREFMEEKLPEYMVPSAIVTLDALPLTLSGKLDRSALPDPSEVKQDKYMAPVTETEKILADIWKDTLMIEEIGIHDNFFELGGHSLLATQIVSRICDTFQIELPLRSIFEARTIAKMAELIEKDSFEGATSSIMEDLQGEEGEL